MRIEPFLMERMQSVHEHEVEINLSESGVEPLSLGELLGEGGVEGLLQRQLMYTQSNGSVELRERIAAIYPGADLDQIEVTNGCAEANFLVCWTLLEPGDEVVMMLPNYMQVWGLARAFGERVRPWRLQPDDVAGRWRADLDELERLANERTRLILICNPNNPTGACLESDELDGIARIADRSGAWILSDEVYSGSELNGAETPSMWGRHERVIVTGGLSKAYGLPGLRIGWIAAPAEQIAAFWSRHDYTTIAPGALSDYLATLALGPERRPRLIERTRSILRANYGLIEDWLVSLAPAVSYFPPRASAMLYLSYRHGINSTELAERLRTEKDVLVVPGDHYGMDGHLRVGYGFRPEALKIGLGRIAELLATLDG